MPSAILFRQGPARRAVRRRFTRAALLSATGLGLALAPQGLRAQDVVVGNGETFEVTVDPTIIDSLTIQSGGTVQLNTNNLVVNDSVDTTWSGTTHGVINDSQLIKNGGGTVTLEDYTQDGGELIVVSGAVQLDSGTSSIRYLAVGSSVSGDATMNMTGGTLKIEALLAPFPPDSPTPTLQVGDFGGSGVFNQSGGLVTIVGGGLNVGNQGGSGVYNLSGGELRLSEGLYSLGRSTTDSRNSDGTMNVSGTGLLNIESGNFIIGDRDNTGPNSSSKGKLVQTGGTIRVPATHALFLSGFDNAGAAIDGQYDLLGGTLEIGGDSLRPRYNNATSVYLFNFGGGTIQVVGSALVTEVDATLVEGTLATVDTNGLGATFSGLLGGSGGLRKTGEGTLTLENAGNSFSGGIQVEAGTLIGAADGALPDHNSIVINGGTLDLNDFALEADGLAGGGGVLDLGSATFTLDQAGDSSFAGSIVGTGGFVKQGAGLLELTGSSSYDGPTAVEDGTLVVNGSLASIVTLSGDARLGGNAALGGLLLGGGTTLAPGNSIGTVNTVDATFAIGSIYEVEVDDLGNADLLDASGTVTINGGTVRVLTALGTQTDTPYLIIDAANPVAGTFDAVETDSLFLDASLDYATDPNQVLLNLVRNATSFASFAGSPNQQAVAEALDDAGPGDPVADAVATAGSAAEAAAAFDALSGELHASTAGLLLDDSRFVREAISRRLEGDPALPKRPLLGGPSVAWAEGFGSYGSWDGDGNAAGVDREGGGFFVGLDTQLDETFSVGLLGGYMHSEIEVDDRGSSASVDSFQVALYGGARFGGLGLQLGGAFAWHQVDSDRQVAIGPLDETLTADYDARTAQVFAEAGWRFDFGGFGLEPFAGLAYIHVGSDGFTEEGGDAALTADDASTQALVSTLGLRGVATLPVGETQALMLRGLVGWRHDLTGETPEADMAFQGGGDFTVQGLPLAEDTLVVQAGLGLEVARGVEVGVNYSGQMGDGISDQGFNATLRISF